MFTLKFISFIERYRLTPHLTIQLISEISPFIQDDVDNAVPLHFRVLAALSFYASGCYQRRVGMDAFCMMSQTSLSKSINEISRAITNNLSQTYIRFPQTQEEVNLIKQRFMDDYNLPGVFGLVDGFHVELAGVSLDTRRAYINRRGKTTINTQGIIDSDMRFLSVNARYPGSTHDTFVWHNSRIFTLLEGRFNSEDQNRNIYRRSFLIGDLGYPLQPWLMIPIRDVRDDHEKKFNKMVRKIRNKNERAYSVLKNRFRCLLGERKLRYNHENAGYIIYVCATLHNFLISNSFDIEYGIPPIQNHRAEAEDEWDEDLNVERNEYLLRGEAVRNKLIDDYF